MAYRQHEIHGLIAARTEESKEAAWQLILSAFVQGNGSRTAAAFNLKCSRSTLALWIKKLGFAQRLKKVEEILKRRGLYHEHRGGAGWHRNRRRETLDPF